MQTIRTAWLLVLATTVACAGADDGSRTDADAQADTTATAAGEPQGPSTRIDSLTIEGQALAVETRPWSTPDDFPLPFSTRLPEPMEADAGDLSGESWVRFSFRDAGSAGPWLRLLLLDETVSEMDARGLVRGIAADFGLTVSQGIERQEGGDAPDFPWARTVFPINGQIRGQAVLGWIALGKHADRFYTLMQVYPPEYGDGAGPRFHYIRDQWRWRDTGAGLERDVEVPDIVEGVE